MNSIINASNLNSQYEQLRREINEQDVYRAFVLNANSLAPEKASGYLLKNRNPLSNLVIAAADTGKDVVELGKALKTGVSNDNQLGRFNDLGMKLGGLGIAAYLSTKRGTGTKGIMEFLGFSAFFASMAMWPKVFISEPMKHRFGFDIRQKYIDSQGRKKLFFQDNQYQPWDLWSDKQLNKIGDKMGIPKDVKDRNELIKEKMRSVALQGNTLWMLTAGFSPLLTSMICNVAEKGVTKGIIHHKYSQLNTQIDNLEQMAVRTAKDSSFDREGAQQMKTLLARYAGIAPDDAFYKNAAIIMDPFRIITESKDIDNINLIGELKSHISGLEQDLRGAYQSTKQTKLFGLEELLKCVSGGVSTSPMGKRKKEITNGKTPDKAVEAVRQYFYGKISKDVTIDEFERALKNISGTIVDPALADKMIRNAKDYVEQSPFDAKIAENYYENVKRLFKEQSKEASARMFTISEFINNLAGQKYESIYTDIHLDSVKSFVKELNPSMKDLKHAAKSTQNAQEYLTRVLAKYAESDSSYAQFIKTANANQQKFESGELINVLKRIRNYADDTFAGLFEKVDVNSPFGFLKKITQQSGSAREPQYKKVIDLFIEEKTAGIKATGHQRVIVADLERRITTGKLLEQWRELGGTEANYKKAVELCREVAYGCTMNNVANKFYQTGNGEDAVRMIKLLYGSKMDETTLANCSEMFKISLDRTRSNIFKIYSQITDLARRGHISKEAIEAPLNAYQKTQYSMLGKSINELFMEAASQKYNDKHWMKIFGGLTVAVIGVTLFAQMFFGKIKNEKLYNKEKHQEKGGVNGTK